jgi:tetratricopeptide (TPR) repeat protein
MLAPKVPGNDEIKLSALVGRGEAHLKKRDLAQALADFDLAIAVGGAGDSAKKAFEYRRSAEAALTAQGKSFPTAPLPSVPKSSGGGGVATLSISKITDPAQFRRALAYCLDQELRRRWALDTICAAAELSPVATTDDKYAIAMAKGECFRALKLKPDSWKARYCVANSHARRAYRVLDKLKVALEAYDAALAVAPEGTPELAELHFDRGDVLYDMKSFDEAVEAFDKTVALNREHKRAYLYRGFAHLRRERYDAAIADFEKAMSLWTAPTEEEQKKDSGPDFCPPNRESVISRAGWYLCAERGKKLAVSGKAAKDKEQQQQAALQKQRKADELKAPAPWPKARIDKTLKDALALDKAGKHEAAVAQLMPLIESYPENLPARMISGYAHLALKDYRAAQSDFTQALKLKPDDATLLSARASAAQNAKNYRGAVEDLTKVIEATPGDWSVWFRRGLAYKALKDHNTAIGDFHQAFNIVANGKVDKDIARNAEFKIRFERADSFLRMKKFNEAIEDFDVTINMQPNNSRLHYMRGNALAYAGRLDEAMQDAEKALALEPGFKPAQQLRAGIESVRNQAKQSKQ